MRLLDLTIGGPVGRFMRRRGWAGVTLPTPFVLTVLFWGDPDLNERLHEYAHIQQIRRMGRIRWTITIIYQYWRHGYEAAPLEIEARSFANQEVNQ